jgi:glycerate dehydrogenase
MVAVDDVFRLADVVSLHCPLTFETEHLVNRARLGLMKPTAFLINTSRGPLVDEAALAEALNGGTIAGAGLDVVAAEPPLEDNPLLKAKHCYVTPHIAWATRAARERLLRIAVENVAAFLAGRPRNVVNGVTE